jgi:hypothetical protein
MKKVKQIKEEMNNIQVELSTGKHESQTLINRIKKKYQFLGLCKWYIESNPTEEFIGKEKERLVNKISLINDGYIPNERLIAHGLIKQEAEERKDYHLIMNTKKFKEQLKAINFLID